MTQNSLFVDLVPLKRKITVKIHLWPVDQNFLIVPKLNIVYLIRLFVLLLSGSIFKYKFNLNLVWKVPASKFVSMHISFYSTSFLSSSIHKLCWKQKRKCWIIKYFPWIFLDELMIFQTYQNKRVTIIQDPKLIKKIAEGIVCMVFLKIILYSGWHNGVIKQNSCLNANKCPGNHNNNSCR